MAARTARRESIETIVHVSTECEAHLQLPVDDLGKLAQIHESYCCGGGRSENLTLMREGAWNSFCRDCKLAVRELNFAAMDLIFITKCKEAGTDGLSFDVFLETLSAFAHIRYGSDSAVALKHDLQVGASLTPSPPFCPLTCARPFLPFAATDPRARPRPAA